MTFEEWLAEVDREIGNLTMGAISMNDLPDWHFYDAWADEMPAREAAIETIRNDFMGAKFLDEMGIDV